jgi:hypothetical protein
MANSLLIEKETGDYFGFTLTVNGVVQNKIRNMRNDAIAVGNIVNFKTSNGANVILKQNISIYDITLIAGGTFLFTDVDVFFRKLIEVGYWDWLNGLAGGGVNRFDELIDTFDYFGKDGQCLIVNESQQKLVTTTLYNKRKFIDLEDTPSTLLSNKMVVVNNEGTALEFKDQPTPLPASLTSVGSFHYVDLATQTTPLTVVAGVEKKITNDIQDPLTNVLNAPYGISSMWNTLLNQLDFTQTGVGDLVTLIPNIEITTTTANQEFSIYVKLGIGSANPTTKQIYNGSLKVAGAIKVNPTRDFTIDNSDIKDYPAEIYILSDANATVKSGELDIKVVRKNINILELNNSYILKAEKDSISSLQSGVVDFIVLVSIENKILLSANATELRSISHLSNPNLYNGRELFLRNEGTVDCTIKHLFTGQGLYNFSFPNGIDFILKPNEQIQFKLKYTTTGSGIYEYVGVTSSQTGAVTGTGTTNYVPKFTSSSVLGDSQIIDNGRVLIGTTTDNLIDKLQVNGRISSLPATTSNQVVVKSQLDLKADLVNGIVPFSQLPFNTISTGLSQGALLTINTDASKFDVASGYGYIVNGHSDPNNPTTTKVTWSAKIANTIPNLATQENTYVAIDINGNLFLTANPLSSTQIRNYIRLGVLVHLNNTVITYIDNQPIVNLEVGGQVQDILEALGFKSLSGNRIFPVGSNLQIKKEAGTVFKAGANFNNLITQPHTFSLTAQNPITFRYRTQTGVEGSDVTNINPGIYDLAGAFTAIPSTATLASIQRIYIFQDNVVRVQPGQRYFSNLNEAVTSINSDVFITDDDIYNNGLYLGAIVLTRNATLLNTLTQAIFVPSLGTTTNGSVPSSAPLGYTPEDVANKQNNLVVDGTGAKYPTVDGVNAGLDLKQNTITNPITGTGTTNKLPKFTASGVLGDSQIIDNGRILIGTTTDNGVDKLQVNESVYFGGKIRTGNNTFSTDDSQILINRNLTTGGTSTGFHALRDETLYNTNDVTGLRAYASFDAITTMQGTAAFNHLHSFQSRPNYSGTGTIDALRGFTHQATINGAVDLHQAIFIDDFIGTGTTNQNVGLYVKSLVKGVSNFAIFTEGTTPSFFGGMIQSNGIVQGTELRASNLNGNYGQVLSVDSLGNLLGNTNLTIINGVLDLKGGTAKLKASATNLDLESFFGVRFFTSSDSGSEKAKITYNGNLLIGTSTDNGVDKLQVNGTILALPATTANQVVVKSQLDLKQNTITNPITGTGTTNYIPKLTGTSALGNSSISDTGSLVTIANPLTIITNVTSSSSNLILSDSQGVIFRGVRSTSYLDNVSTRFFQIGVANDVVAFTTQNATTANRLLFTSLKTSFTNQVYTSCPVPIGMYEIVNNGVVALSVSTGGRTLVNTTTDNGVDKLQVEGSIKTTSSIQVGDNILAASGSNVGAIRYRATANNSFNEMVMQTGASTYAWVIIKQNTW